MNNLKIKELKNYLKDKSNDELIREIINIVKKFPKVKEYYSSRISPEHELKILESYKNIIKNEFSPKRGKAKVRYSVINETIDNFKIISNNKVNIADIMLCSCEFGFDFIKLSEHNDYEFYNKVEDEFEKILEYISNHQLDDVFNKRIVYIVEKTYEIIKDRKREDLKIKLSYIN